MKKKHQGYQGLRKKRTFLDHFWILAANLSLLWLDFGQTQNNKQKLKELARQSTRQQTGAETLHTPIFHCLIHRQRTHPRLFQANLKIVAHEVRYSNLLDTCPPEDGSFAIPRRIPGSVTAFTTSWVVITDNFHSKKAYSITAYSTETKHKLLSSWVLAQFTSHWFLNFHNFHPIFYSALHHQARTLKDQGLHQGTTHCDQATSIAHHTKVLWSRSRPQLNNLKILMEKIQLSSWYGTYHTIHIYLECSTYPTRAVISSINSW